ncbi:MAG: arsenate reductase (glutaredoxin) [Planctomycetota bacterium]
MNEPVTIYHNPRCSKSRATLELLRERGIEPEVVEYLKDAPSRATLKRLIQSLGASDVSDLTRTKEAVFKELGLANEDDRERWIDAIVENPVLLERPIVVVGNRARVGRPPENVLEILDS